MNKITAGLIFGVILLTMAAVLLARPASTPPIRDQHGSPMPNSIASLEKVEIGGMGQYILVRGEDIANPILLWLHGGPGASQMPVARHFNGDLEKDFTVVHWDQRGAGKSNPRDFGSAP